ncbi:conjugative transposon protein TraK [Chitinophaga sp. NPDC101104]|uniref:conjugative transposon protein TraK n=1 Tax=Chitinophaga sp. NPDC101104 TaxID=3390561 RepID=UPI003CFE6789
MFKQLNNIDNAFKHVRLFTFVIIISLTTLCGYCVWFCITKVTEAYNRIYVISEGQALSANASTRAANIPIEAKHHILMFHQQFFTLSPDEKAIQTSVAKSLYLADISAKEAYDNLREKGYYTAIVSGNVSQEVICDSIQLDISTAPYQFRFFGKQRIIRSSAIVTRRLITSGLLRNVTRSDNNPHGFLIEKWTTIENNDLEFKQR